ncbi:bifunctional [glutamine synthetase] adenylyltransferase/[glutamine synthetase]-adenylyl-L-tyrosine phosphorylase [Maricaulis sp.]|jgi:glutamate-ammonia-ligase adenylyltransferase|uniref:bifunctional [glutamine synthetase] adenylyltransferase/[glutamine synthetase]-adenylyl-L-tyrosine phosphorylase n=1 Tax=Maricaulis sp. TaxID=1486257 RepID=UPI000C396170|nr:bifunctional [glutamine synthetase] adenylyltransferase/[glutamine synthetase]-adenylyl-L-tyrosine phosphorylase [Maricaulis sp.]MAC90718.1 bifunctional [glutamate--ammonia ligase]-adenylyl-L-tyrosine phosphorylase/[glutamate--ammonia-ligase] adenylyltransferase [Maricaulis sp.]
MTDLAAHPDCVLPAGLAPLPGRTPGAAAHMIAALPDTVGQAIGPARDFLDTVFAAAPYLARLAQRRADTLEACLVQTPDALISSVIADLHRAGAEAADPSALDIALRHAKSDAHLVTALADLTGVWDVREVTGAMTRVADAALQAALHAHVRFLAEQGRAHPVTNPDNPIPGVVILALGKMGTGDLNYSSDIDLVAVYDPDSLSLPESEEPRKRLPRLIQAVVKSLQDVTAEGYVFRVDLRLRPDPGATPVIISTEAALNYYESLGQTWERAAWIKARASAGDRDAAARFLAHMQPFIWRRSLDYAAIDDIRGLARQIQTVGRRAEIRPAGHDLKLGRGGIREIEFYAQIPQLVFGGRDERVREPSTLAALGALAVTGAVEPDVVDALARDYRDLRSWEHRIQMRQDEPSQTVPLEDEDRADLAALSGFADVAAFETAVEACLQRVHGHFSDQFEGDEALSSSAGSLILTGVEPTPDTITTLQTLGFSQPGSVWATLNGWAGGRVRAVRSSRARTLFARIAPQLVDRMSATGEPDAAMTRFAAFFENLPMGVQPLSLLSNEPGLAADLIGILTLAPRLASDLARRPALLDAMLDDRFSVPLGQDPADSFKRVLDEALERAGGYEDRLNSARRRVREERFRIGAQILNGMATAQTAGAAFSAMADATLAAMARAAQDETERRFGPMPGEGVILGMGKLGGRELAADSDLDIMIIYQGDETASGWFGRFATRLISALSAPTEEGELYTVDMQLRPSGKAGPVAVSLSRFDSYYPHEAWTWEMMALTRARIIAGDGPLADAVTASFERALCRPRDGKGVREDARAMRQRLAEAKPPSSIWDLKARPGGLQDIEFIAQTLQLIHADREDVVRASTREALQALGEAGVLPAGEVKLLTETLQLQLGVLQMIRCAHGSGFDPAQASSGFATRLAELAGCAKIEALEAALDRRMRAVRKVFERRIGKM